MTTMELDVAVFHRSGVEGACHIEKGVEGFLQPVSQDPQAPEEGRTFLLTEEGQEELPETYRSYIDGMRVDPDNPEEHPKVYNVKSIGGFVFDG